MYREWKKTEFPKEYSGTTRLRGRPTNRWQDDMREDGRIFGGEWWQEKVDNRKEWKKLLRTAWNCHILHMPIEWMNELLLGQNRFLSHNHALPIFP